MSLPPHQPHICGPKQFVCPNPRTHIMASTILRGPSPMFVSDTSSDAYSKLGSYLQLRRGQTRGSSRFITASRMPTFMNRSLSRHGPGRIISVPIPPNSNLTPRTRILATEESGSIKLPNRSLWQVFGEGTVIHRHVTHTRTVTQ